LRQDADETYTLYLNDAAQPDPWVPLTQDEFSIIKGKRPGAAPPTYYSLMGGHIYLRPIPDAAYTLRLLYYGADNVLDTLDSTNLWLVHAADWFVAEVGFIIASQYMSMPESAKVFEMDRREARARVMNDTIARREAGWQRAMGDD
jgi:hypothetical protein